LTIGLYRAASFEPPLLPLLTIRVQGDAGADGNGKDRVEIGRGSRSDLKGENQCFQGLPYMSRAVQNTRGEFSRAGEIDDRGKKFAASRRRWTRSGGERLGAVDIPEVDGGSLYMRVMHRNWVNPGSPDDSLPFSPFINFGVMSPNQLMWQPINYA
jgi:hypothetical protein